MAKEIVRKYISDKRAADAVCCIIDSFGGDTGIGLGSQVSQLVQLMVLNGMDHFIKEQLHIKYYIRYMDDFILIHEDREYLKKCRKLIEDELSRIGLCLNRKTSLSPLKQGIWFLKWRFVLTDTGKVLMLIDPKKIVKERKRLKKLLEMEMRGKVPPGTADNSLICWIANAQRGDTYKVVVEMKRFYERLRRDICESGVPPEKAAGVRGSEF